MQYCNAVAAALLLWGVTFTASPLPPPKKKIMGNSSQTRKVKWLTVLMILIRHLATAVRLLMVNKVTPDLHSLCTLSEQDVLTSSSLLVAWTFEGLGVNIYNLRTSVEHLQLQNITNLLWLVTLFILKLAAKWRVLKLNCVKYCFNDFLSTLYFLELLFDECLKMFTDDVCSLPSEL